MYQARVAYRGLRKAAFRPTREAARDAESELLRDLKEKAGQAEQEAQRPATLRQLFDFYLSDLEARGKGDDTVGRAEETRAVIERLMPEPLDTPVSRIGETEIFAFRQHASARARWCTTWSPTSGARGARQPSRAPSTGTSARYAPC